MTPIERPGALPPLRVTVAPNGARRGKDDHPQLPVTTSEIVTCARQCWQAGAHEIHLHVRDQNGAHSLSADRYRETIAALHAEVPDMAVQITTEAAGRYEVAEQFALLKDLKPNAASIAVRESLRAPDLVPHLYAFALEAGISVQHILYDRGDLDQLSRMIDQGMIPDTMRDVLLVFGAYSPPRLAQPEEVAPFVTAMQGAFPNWTVCAFGRNEPLVAKEAIRLGGHVRIGFENNIERPDGTLAKDNAENIARTVQTAQSLNRPLQHRPK